MRIIHRPFARLSPLPTSLQERYKVAPDEWRRTMGGILVGEYAGDSGLFVALNEHTHEGIFGHFSNISGAEPRPTNPGARVGQDEFEEALAAARELSPRGRTFVWMGGLALADRMGVNENAETDRAHAEQRVAEELPGVGGVRTEWTPEGFDMVHARLDAGRGTVEVEVARFTGPHDAAPGQPPAA